MNYDGQIDWLWTVAIPLAIVIALVVIPFVLSLVFNLSFLDVSAGMMVLVIVVAFISLEINSDDTSKDKVERMVEERKRDLEVVKQTTPYQEIVLDNIRLLPKEQQEEDEVKNEVFLYTPLEAGLETAYVEISFQHMLELKTYRFPAYIQYADVEKAHMRYQLINGDVYNAVVTLPNGEEVKGSNE